MVAVNKWAYAVEFVWLNKRKLPNKYSLQTLEMIITHNNTGFCLALIPQLIQNTPEKLFIYGWRRMKTIEKQNKTKENNGNLLYAIEKDSKWVDEMGLDEKQKERTQKRQCMKRRRK